MISSREKGDPWPRRGNRRAVRQKKSKPILDELKPVTPTDLSAKKTKLAEAIRYAALSCGLTASPRTASRIDSM